MPFRSFPSVRRTREDDCYACHCQEHAVSIERPTIAVSGFPATPRVTQRPDVMSALRRTVYAAFASAPHISPLCLFIYMSYFIMMLLSPVICCCQRCRRHAFIYRPVIFRHSPVARICRHAVALWRPLWRWLARCHYISMPLMLMPAAAATLR